MNWSKVTLATEEVRDGKDLAIQQAFRRIWVAAWEPVDVALLAEALGPDGGCRLYFSPGAARFARFLIASYGGIACEPPPAHARLLVGHAAFERPLLTISGSGGLHGAATPQYPSPHPN
jgi:hypothetical protein